MFIASYDLMIQIIRLDRMTIERYIIVRKMQETNEQNIEEESKLYSVSGGTVDRGLQQAVCTTILIT